MKTLYGQTPVIIAHRGVSGNLPEHTLESFHLALEQGADFIETDYIMRQDGVPIVRHEPLLDKTTIEPKVRGKSPGWEKGRVRSKRRVYPLVKKGTARKKKIRKSTGN